MKPLSLCLFSSVILGLFPVVPAARGQVVNSEWNTANGNWNVPANWTPVDVPDNGGGFTYNVQIGNRPVAANAQVTFIPEDQTGDIVSNLTISGGADLFTNSNQLSVTTQATISGTGSTIRVDPHNTAGTVSLLAANVDLNTGGAIVMRDSIATVSALLEINSGVLSGRGLINLGDTDATVETALENSGLIQLLGDGTVPAILTLHANGVDTIDLDGTSETGVVDVSNALADVEGDTLTLVVDGPLSDPLGGTAGSMLQIGQRDTVTFNENFTMGAGLAVQMDGGNNVATMNGPGAVTLIAGTAFTITGAAVIDNDLTFTGTANTITANAASSLTLNGDVTMPDASALALAASAQLIVGGHLTVSEAGGDFNWDGSGTATTTVQGTGLLTINVSHVDAGNDTYGGTLNLNDNADASVTVAGTSWTAAGTINKNNAGTSTVSGDPIVLTGNLNANAGTLNLPASTLSAGADVTVNGVLSMGTGSTLSGPATLTGTGTLRMTGASNVAANTTVAVNTFDWDGNTVGHLHSIADGVTLTITSPNIDSDGDMDDAISLGGNGAQLIVNGPAEWTMTGTLTANAAAAGTATIGGTSRLILAGPVNVDGNTNISAPLTFSTGAAVSIDAGMTLNATGNADYNGGTISGAGTYEPGTANTVTADTSITATNFNFDGGNWTINNGATLTVNVTDYEPATTTNSFEAIVTLNSSDVSMTTGDAAFVMNGTLNASTTSPNDLAVWSGEPLEIGNDAGVADANVNVAASSHFQIFADTDFNSDADVRIADGATLSMIGPVTFHTLNSPNAAQFTGTGTFAFSNDVSILEPLTFNMQGGTVDLDGLDASGDTISVTANFTINAKTMASFGKTNVSGGPNILDINRNTAFGSLTVNLDDPAAEWTLNAPGVMNIANSGAAATVLDGSPVNLLGTVNVTGETAVAAKVRLRGTTNITSGGLVLRKTGLTAGTANTLEGGIVNGPGTLRAETGCALRGNGTINAPVDFSTGGELVASGGLLDVNGTIVAANIVRVEAAPAVLDLAASLNTSVLPGGIVLSGGTLQGATVTSSSTARPVSGQGLVASSTTNSGALSAVGGTLVFSNPFSDWDGAANNGVLRAEPGAVLELRDNAAFGFTGSAVANGGRIFTNGFGLDFNPGSTLVLSGGTYESTNTTPLGGTVSVSATGGAESTIIMQSSAFLQFEAGSTTTLNANLRLRGLNSQIAAGAVFSGTGALIIAPDGVMHPAPNAAINVLVNNQGGLQPASLEAVGRVDLRDYQQAAGAELFIEVRGVNLNEFDRVVVSGAAQLHGHLDLDIDGGFVPVTGQTFDILTATAGVTGKFDLVTASGMPNGLGFTLTYLPNAVRATVTAKPPYDDWVESRNLEAVLAGITPNLETDWPKSADPDKDGLTNIGEFALNGHPFIGSRPNKIFPKVASVSGTSVFTLTIPVRNGAVPDPLDPAGGELVLKQTADVLTYKIQAGDTLTNDWTLDVAEVTGASATAIQSGLPPPDTGWTYRTFRSPGPVAGDPREFMRVVVTE